MSVVACLIESWAVRCGAQVTLAWNPSVSAGVTNYNVCWGTNSGNYFYTNNYPGVQTNATVSNLAAYGVYFFAVQSVDSIGLVSVFSSEVVYTNGAPAGAAPLSVTQPASV